MKVLQINTVYKTGGSTGRIVYDLQQFSQENMESYVAFGYGKSFTHDKNTFKMESILELKINILKTRLFAHHGFYNQIQTKRLLNYINKIKPDIIHLHNLHNHYVNVKMLFDYIKSNNVPVIWTLHDCWSFTGWCAYFDFIDCDRWKRGCANCPNKNEYPYTWFLDRSSKNYAEKKACFQNIQKLMIVTPSNWLDGLVKQSFLSEYPIQVIHNGIDLSIFKPMESKFKKKYGINSKKMILAVSMGLSKRKGIAHIYKLAEMFDQEKQVIVIVGLSKKQIDFLPKGILGVPRTNSSQELAKIYSAADVFINPTLEDNYPTTNLEAIACGTPVVTYRTGGSPESVFEGCCEVVDKGNFLDFYKAVNCVLKKGKDIAHCVEIAKLHFDKNNCFQQYIALYRKMGEKE